VYPRRNELQESNVGVAHVDCRRSASERPTALIAEEAPERQQEIDEEAVFLK
jgi:hypothetical protein